MIGPHAIVIRGDASTHGLDLVLTPYDRGFNYEWQDGHGRVYCSGWVQGSRRDATGAARRHLTEGGSHASR